MLKRGPGWLWILLWIWGCSSPAPKVAPEALEALVQDQLVEAQRLLTTYPDSSFALARQALSTARASGYSMGELGSQLTLAQLYEQQAVFSKAIEALLAALRIADAIGDTPHQAQAHRMLGDLYERTKQTEFALAEYRHAIRLYTLQTDSSGLADLFNSLGHFYEKETQYDSALYYQGRALALQHKAQNITGLAATHDDVGSIFEDLEQFDTALYHFRQARFFNQQARYWEGAIINLNNLGDVYRKTGRPAEGLAYTLRALEEARTHGLKYQLRSAYRDLAKSHFEQADYATAYAYQDSAYNLNAEIYSGEIAQQIGQTQALYEVGQKEQQIALLEKDQALSLTRQRALLGGAIALALVGGLVVMQFRSRSRKSRQLYMTERELREAEKANTELREEQLQQELDAKSKSLTTSALHIIQKNEFLEDLRQELKQIRKGEPEEMAKKLKGLSKSIDFNFNLDKDWSEFETVFQQVHQAFFDALNRQYPDLSATEVRLCAMIRLNLNSKDISSIMGIAQDSLRIARYRLRKKMGLEKGANLYAYIQTLE